MKNLLLVTLSVGALLFSGCSSKKVFEPEDTSGSWEKYEDISDNIIDTTSTAALFENRKVLANETELNVEIAENYRLIGNSDGWILSSTIDGKLQLQSIDDQNNTQNIELKKTVASASIKDDMLAVVFADNEIGLYSISSKELLFKEKVGDYLAIDARIASPYFVGGVVVFPTLDGKVVIINAKTKQRLRTAIVSSEDNFNNVLYFNILNKKVIAATAYKILSMDQEELRAKYEIRSVASNDESIYIATKQGEIIALTPELQIKSKLKFPFAHFLGLIAKNDKLYILEKEGYLIVAEKDLSTYSIHDVSVDEEDFIFVSGKGFYVNDELISVE